MKNNSLHPNIISLFRKGTLWPSLISTPLTRGPLVLLEEDKGCTLSSPQHSLRTPCPQDSGAVHRVLAALLKGDKMKLHLLSTTCFDFCFPTDPADAARLGSGIRVVARGETKCRVALNYGKRLHCRKTRDPEIFALTLTLGTECPG